MKKTTLLSLVAFACATPVFGGDLKVEVGSARAPGSYGLLTDAAARQFARRTTALSTGLRTKMIQAKLLRTKVFFPTRVVLTDKGRPLAGRSRGPGDIVPTFDTSGAHAFSADDKAFLQSTFTAAKPAIDAVFGVPFAGGVVHVRNYDADIQDRYAVAGGYYVPNGTGGPEIRIPVYLSRTAMAVNYIHCLLLAYMGSAQYAFDAYDEGFVRAATMVVARTPGSIPGSPGKDQIEAVLSNLYDVGSYYDWFNKPSVGASRFIAPNLLDSGLPLGGSTGGIFLLRYQLAGTAMAKLAVRYPGFIAEFNKRFYANPAQFGTSAALESLGQQVLDFVGGGAGSKIEGRSFQSWAEHQYILDLSDNPGLKLVPTVVPIPAQSGSSDFGVFNIVVNAFQVLPNRNETLLSGTAYPIYWRNDFQRFFASSQDDIIRIAGAYGSVTPNFTSSISGGKVFRATIDVPFGSRVCRTVVPAGTLSTGGSPAVKSFVGTVQGLSTGPAYTVDVSWAGGAKTAVPVVNNAFGFDITDTNYLKPGPITVVVRQGTTEKIRREVVKSEGNLALDLTVAESDASYSLQLPAKLSMAGLPLDPFRPAPATVLGLSPAQILLGRWDAQFGKYISYPLDGEIKQGLGYWTRPPSAVNKTVRGTVVPGIPVSVPLSAGWNQVTVPSLGSLSTTDVLVTVSFEAVGTYDQATADGTLGPTLFEYVPDATNPDKGTMSPTSTFTPGKAVFVRANRPEGAVLVFVPKGGTKSPTGGSGRPLPQYSVSWATDVQLVEQGGWTCSVRIGQAAGATRRLDPVIDSELPPLQSGFQLCVLNGANMANDFRPSGTLESFDLRVRGLIAGRPYRLRFNPSSFAPQSLLTDGSNQMVVTSNQTYDFVAQGTEKRFTLQTLVVR